MQVGFFVLFSFVLFSSSLWAQDAQPISYTPQQVRTNKVQLMLLDKLTGRSQPRQAYMGETIQFGTLFITPRSCYKTPESETPENKVFLEIEEQRPGQLVKSSLFDGWMFSSSPSLSAMDHAEYDVWVLACVD